MYRILLLLLFALPYLTFCQSGFSPGFSLIAEYSMSSFDTKGMNGFVNSFNEFWGSKLSEPYSTFSGNEFSHPNFGAGFRVISQGKVGFSASTAFLFGRRKYKHSAMWTNGVGNELGFKVRDLQWTVTTGMHLNSLLYIEGYMDANARKIELTHTTIYQDGSRSLSSEYKLNGLYTGSVASLDVGIQAGLRLAGIMLYVKPSWPMNNFPPGKDIVTLDDYTTVNYPPSDFPSDYAIYSTDPIRFVEENLGVKTDDYEGFRLAFGIEIILGAINNTDKD